MFEQHRNKFSISDEKWLAYTSCFTRMELPAKKTLLSEGEISKKIFFIEKGCVRAWFNNNGKDISFQFFFENNTVASIESFRKKIASPLSLETIEPTILWWAHKKDIDKIVSEITEDAAMRAHFIDMIFDRSFVYMKHFLSFIRDTPEERYLQLIKEKPQLIQRVPQHYIASYLGISTVHLSRIKNKIAKKRK